MSLQIYNTLTRSKEEFVPLVPERVGMYVCGMTVYSDAHIGSGKSYVSFDIVRRYLQFLGYHVTFVQNVTDVGHMTDNDEDQGVDKLVKKGAEIKQHPMQIAETFTRRTSEDLARLNILPPDIMPRATGHIIEQIEIIKDLIAKGYAYEINGSVYFDVTKDKEYGKLSGRNTEDQETSGRVESRSEKRNPQDFALWKKAEKGHILRWPSPWGEGFPGWHIECSAMSMKYLGETFDIHGGGLENQFPHHECEIAQSECSTGKPFVRYWMHNNMVTVDGQKMGKSLGNSSYLRDIFMEFDPMTVRYYLLQSHYRSTTEYKKDAIAAAGVGYAKLLSTFRRLAESLPNQEFVHLTQQELVHPLVRQFLQEMDDDFNTPKAIAVLYDLAKETNALLTGPSPESSKLAEFYHIWMALAGNILGILPQSGNQLDSADSKSMEDVVASLMTQIISWRKSARERKDFALSDAIRDDLTAAGIVLEDSKEGTKWSLR
ncbi:MAG: cysteine--tRNA ligase [Bacteroidota bacterium]|nr:cysteine--tRNA ligase [Bacteroidota bacterium]MDP4228802.1 cysteine--tRNA ligase [Bacteroidota bacterium]MDP4237190.1 cysteine--tRNA ligase [Bacteroidota bacterium]